MKSTIPSTALPQIFKIIILIFIFTPFLNGQVYTPTPENLAAREQFQKDKFGLFIHWGVYSILGDGEWVMQVQGIPIDAYEKLPPMFNPIDFDAKEWVAIAKAAGMNYITITSKHHDGFAMYDSKISDYNIVKASPYGKDIIKALADECEKEGLRFYVYYSQLDWHHPDYFPRGRTGHQTGRANEGDWNKYLDYQNAQIKELAEDYNIDGFWFDGWWDQQNQPAGAAEWNLQETYKIIHDVNSALLIGNNHHVAPFPGEDFQMFEKDLPGSNTTGFGTSADDIGNLPMETCETINHSWGFNLQDYKHKSIKTLIQYLVKASGYGANFLLNVGPMPNGKIQMEHVQNLKAMGEWLQINGETIYETKAGPVSPQDWGVTTENGNKVYFHILNPANNVVLVQGYEPDISSMNYYKGGKKVEYQKVKNGFVIYLDEDQINEYDTIIELTVH